MDLQADIKWITSKIQKVDDPDLIEAFKRMLKFREKTMLNTLEAYNRDIELAEADIKAGRIHSQEEIEKMREQWKKEL